MGDKSSQLLETIADLRQRLTAELLARDSQLLDAFPVGRYIDLLDAYPAFARWTHISPRVKRFSAGIQARIGGEGMEAYHQLLLLALSERADEQLPARDLPDDIRALYRENFERIARRIERGERGRGLFLHPRFCKELGICTGRLIPAGVQIVYPFRLPRRPFVTPPLGHILSWIRLVLRVGGISRFYELHTPSDDAKTMLQFNPAGWTQFYRRAAELLRRNPRMKGLCASAWFFDPAMEHVSPRLAYLRTMVTDNGGLLFRVGPCGAAGIRDATVFSPERKRLCAEGRYAPTDYLVIWPRKELIAWAEKVPPSPP